MKVLVTNYAKTSTITALDASVSYPAENVAHVFLDKIFISELITDTLTVDFGSDKSVNCVFIAGCNATSVDVVIKNAALAPVYTGTTAITADEIVIYPGTVTGRYLTITGTAVGSDYFKIKGVGVGVYVDLGTRSFQSDLPITNATTMTTSPYGQMLANRAPTLRSRSVSISVPRKESGFSLANSIRDTFKDIGLGLPAYWDMNDVNSDEEPPIYGAITSPWSTSFDMNAYTVSFQIQECR